MATLPETKLRPLARTKAAAEVRATVYPFHHLTSNEEEELWKFMDSAKVRKIMRGEGAQLALVFSACSGIGIGVTAKVRNSAGEAAEADITDVSSW